MYKSIWFKIKELRFSEEYLKDIGATNEDLQVDVIIKAFIYACLKSIETLELNIRECGREDDASLYYELLDVSTTMHDRFIEISQMSDSIDKESTMTSVLDKLLSVSDYNEKLIWNVLTYGFDVYEIIINFDWLQEKSVEEKYEILYNSIAQYVEYNRGILINESDIIRSLRK